MTTTIEVRGLDEVMSRMEKYPDQLRQVQQVGVDATMLTLNESVPSYPPQPGSGSAYDRTGTLGRSLGSGEGGGAAGQADIFEVHALGDGFEGRFGTALDYAPNVIGDEDQAAHMGYWWQMKDVAERAAGKIERIWQDIGEKLAAFLERG